MRTGWAAGLAFVAACAGGESEGPGFELITRDLSPSLTLASLVDATGPTNSLVLTGSDGTLLVDHYGDWQTLTVPDEAVAVLRRAWVDAGHPDPAVIINTHWHGDHSAGNLAYGSSALVVAHANTRARLARAETPFWFDRDIGPLSAEGLPDSTFTDSTTIDFNGETIHLWNFGRAHTDGDAVVYFADAGVVHMGDLFHGLANPSVGADMVGLAHTIGMVLARVPGDTQVVTGHAGVTTRDELTRYHLMLTEALDAVRSAIANGGTLEEVQQAGLPPHWRDAVPSQDMVSAWLAEMYRTLSDTTAN